MSIHTPRDRYVRFLLAPLFALGCSDGDLVAAPLEEPPPAVQSGKVVGGGGLSLAVYEAGQAGGPPIVFIHGFTGNYLTWERQFSGPLAAEFRLVAYDLRGHGASDKPLEAARYTDAALWAEDLAAVIRAKNLDRPVLVGWSYGGYVIADYLRKFGDSTIGGVVFLGSSTKNGTAEAAGFLTEEVLAVFGDVLSADLRRSIDGTRALTRMFASPLGGAAWETAYGSAMMVPPEVRAAMFSRVLDNDDVLAGIRVPTLVIHGGGDRIVRVSAGRHTTTTVPSAKLLVYDGVGHALQLESPERLGRDLAEFVRAGRRSRTP
jgi:pimeloyl-ACP methyl ester carboxylesterase